MSLKKITKTIAVLLLHTFLFHEIALGASAWKPQGLDLWQSSAVSIQIPSSVATIEESYQSRMKNRPLIYLVQDAHTNESAQLNIAKTLDTLIEKEGIKYLFLEGGTGNNSLSYLRETSSLEDRRRVARSFLSQGEIAGWEYLDLTSERSFTLWGTEDEGLYWESLEVYREVADKREKFLEYLGKIGATAESLKPRIFNPSLSAFDKKYQAYLNEKISLSDYLETLTSEASRFGLPLSYFPHIQSFKVLKEKEATLDFAKATQEQAEAVKSFSAQDHEALLAMSDTTAQGPFRVGHSDRAEQKGFYALFEEILTRGGRAQAGRYPELLKYFDYLKEFQKMDAETFLAEQEALEKQVLARLIQSQDEKDLYRSSECVRLLRKLFGLSWTPAERERFDRDLSDLGIEKMTGFLNRKVMDLNDEAGKVIFLEKEYDDFFKKAERFYSLTYRRDRALLQNTLDKMEKEGERKAVLIAGGYHASNLKTLLQNAGVSYVSIRPQIYHETNQKRYEGILLDQTPGSVERVDLISDSIVPAKNIAIQPATQRPNVLSALHERLGAVPRAQGARLAAPQIVAATPAPAPNERFYQMRYDPIELGSELSRTRNIQTKDIQTYTLSITSQNLAPIAANATTTPQDKLSAYFKVLSNAIVKLSEKHELNINPDRLGEYFQTLIAFAKEEDRAALLQRFDDIRNNKVAPLKIAMGNSPHHALSVMDTQENTLTIDSGFLMYFQTPEVVEVLLAVVVAHQFFGVMAKPARALASIDTDVRLGKDDVRATGEILKTAKKFSISTGNTFRALDNSFNKLKEPGEVPFTSYYYYHAAPESIKKSLKIPDLLLNRYRPETILGQGGMGVVLMALDTVENRKVAIKIPLFQNITNHEARRLASERFQREIKLTSAVDSPSVVKLLDNGSYKVGDNEYVFFVMEYVPWRTLKDWIKKYDSMSMVEVVGVMIRVLEGLKAIHDRDLIHRDIKPENIMIRPDGKRIVIMDLGMAKDTHSDKADLTQSNTAMGTPAYMAPEQASGDTKRSDRRADLFSAGVMFYEMATRTKPFRGETALQILMAISQKDVKPEPPSDINTSVDPELESIILRSLAKDPKKRYQNADEFIADLESWLVQNEESRSNEFAKSMIIVPKFTAAKKAEIIKRKPNLALRAKAKGSKESNTKGPNKMWLIGGLAGAGAVSLALFFGGAFDRKKDTSAAQNNPPVTTQTKVTPTLPKIDPRPKVDPPKVDPQPKVDPPKVDPAPKYGKLVAHENLVAHFTFDEIKPDGTVVDSSKGLIGKVHGATIVPGKIGNALKFDGVDDYLSDVSVKVGGNITLSMWIKLSVSPGTVKQMNIISRTKNFGIILRNGVPAAVAYGQQIVEGKEKVDGKALEPERWYHLILRVNDSAVDLWVDGARVFGGGVKDARLLSDRSDFKIGHKIDENPSFSGAVDDLRLYDKALFDHILKQIYYESRNSKPGGARLASPVKISDNAQELRDLEEFSIKLWNARKNQVGNEFAMNFGELTKILKLSEETKDGKIVRLTLLARLGEYELPVLVIDEPRRKLEALRRIGEDAGALTPQDIASALSLSALNSRTAVVSPAGNSQVDYAIGLSLGYFAGIGDPELFRSQLAQFLAQAAKHYEFARSNAREVTFLLRQRELLADWQKNILDQLDREVPPYVKQDLFAQKYEGVVVELLDAGDIKSQPQNDGKKVFFSIGSLSENQDAVLSWNKAFAIADWLGGRYAVDPGTNTVDFNKVRGTDSDLQRVLTYYQSHQKNTQTKIQADRFLRMVQGQASIEEYQNFALNLPILKKVPLHLLVQAARLALKAIGSAA